MLQCHKQTGVECAPLGSGRPPAGGAADLTPHCIQTGHHGVA